MRWLQNEDHTWRQWAIVNWIWIRWRWGPIPIGHENTTTMQTKIPKQPKSSNSHSRRRSPWVKWPPAVPIWLQWAIARSTFWRSVNSQVNISDWVTSNLLWFVWPNSYFKREFVLKFILQFPGRAASPCQVSRPSVAAIFKTNPALIFVL